MQMASRQFLLILTFALLSLMAATGWWYFSGAVGSGNRQAQQAALDAGISRFREGAYEQALGELSSVPSAHPQGWRARYYEGSAQIMLRDYEAGVRLLEEALELNPRSTRVMHALGVAHFKRGDLAMAKAYFAQVLEVDPMDEEAKGLMDTMAELERLQGQQPAASPPDGG